MAFFQGFLSGAEGFALVTRMRDVRPVFESVVAEGASGVFSPAVATPIVVAATEATRLVLRKSRLLNSFLFFGLFTLFISLLLSVCSYLVPAAKRFSTITERHSSGDPPIVTKVIKLRPRHGAKLAGTVMQCRLEKPRLTDVPGAGGVQRDFALEIGRASCRER